MAKIYNEIVIDMNPESSTFEETLYEDSFEYNGDMMFMQEADLYAPFPGNTGEYIKWVVDSNNQWQMQGGAVQKSAVPGNAKLIETAPIRFSDAVDANSYESLTGNVKTISGVAEAGVEAENIRQQGITTETAGQTDWGAANITKDMFINADGTPKSIQDIYATLDPILTGITGEALVNQIKDMMPQYTGVSTEEKGFLAKEREFRERGLGAKKEADIYGLRPDVGGAVTPTTGAGARGQIATKTGVKKGFGAAQTAYGLGMEGAEFAETKGLYGLEKAATGEFETGVVGAIGEMDSPFVAAGTDALTSEWGTFNWSRKGGKVPDRGETFLDFLTQLPDAGGT